ncbi:MAG: hypothetical protein RJQ04_09420 [Longimicrobiales bacterium]
MRRSHAVRSTAVLSLLAALSACGGPDPDAAPPEQEDGAPSADAAPARADGVEAISFLGEELRPPELAPATRENHMARYAEAEEALDAAPEDVDALIWMGRRTAYLGEYRNAIAIYSHALELHPDEPRLYRHRGHRYVSVRELDNAVADFERAAALTEGQPDQVEPDGLPNAAGIPTSTLQFNIWYHLGLAHYLAGDFEAAAEAYARCADVSVHPDSKVATAYWRTLTLLRLGRDAEAEAVMAAITPDMEVIESGGYLDLVLLFKGERTPDDILGAFAEDVTLAGTTATYGVGMWHKLRGDPQQAEELFRLNLSGDSQWAAFGYIASEAELAAVGNR